MAKRYDETHPRLVTILTDEQRQIVEELARREGVTLARYMRDYVLRNHIEALGMKWPEGYFGQERGARKGAGRPPKK